MANPKAVRVVDDVQANTHTIKAILGKHYYFQEVTGGEKALQIASKVPTPDLILMPRRSLSKAVSQILLLLTAAVLSWAVMVSVTAAQETVIRIAAPDWAPTQVAEEIIATYQPASEGVRVEMHRIPWPEMYETITKSLASGEEKYHMLNIDSQWMGAIIEKGYGLKMNRYIDSDPELKTLVDAHHPGLFQLYTTYPHRSRNIYGIPFVVDTMVAFYREDLFCHEVEAKAFRKKYGRPLPCNYDAMIDLDWKTVVQIGEFFTRKKGELLAGKVLEEDFYGLGLQYSPWYDQISMFAVPFFWQYDGGIWDETREPDAKVLGVVDSKNNEVALEDFMALRKYHSPDLLKLDLFRTTDDFKAGRVAYMPNWAVMGSWITDKNTSKVWDKFSVAQPPGRRRSDGTLNRWWNIGGQPMIFSAFSSKNKRTLDEMLAFLKWWLSEDTQWRYVLAGGTSALVGVHQRQEFQRLQKWNLAFVETFDYQKDLWHIPEFFQLLDQQQRVLGKIVANEMTIAEGLKEIARFQHLLLVDLGRVQ